MYLIHRNPLEPARYTESSETDLAMMPSHLLATALAKNSSPSSSFSTILIVVIWIGPPISNPDSRALLLSRYGFGVMSSPSR